MNFHSDWKNDPNFFLMMKVQYGMWLGVLQGYLLAAKQLDADPANALEYYDKLVNDIENKLRRLRLLGLQEIVGDTFNCGWADQCPTFDEIVKESDDLLLNTFKISVEDFEKRVCVECGETIKKVTDQDRPATAEDIADMQKQMEQVANDPDLTIVTIHMHFDKPHCSECMKEAYRIEKQRILDNKPPRDLAMELE